MIVSGIIQVKFPPLVVHSTRLDTKLGKLLRREPWRLPQRDAIDHELCRQMNYCFEGDRETYWHWRQDLDSMLDLFLCFNGF